MKENISKHELYCIVLVPEKGKARKRDLEILNEQSSIGGYRFAGRLKFSGSYDFIVKHLLGKESAKKETKRLKGLNKPYKAYIITDSQFREIEFKTESGKTSISLNNRRLEESKIVR